METKHTVWNPIVNLLRSCTSLTLCAKSKGQAMVEFTLVFMLLLVVAWIPADFGLAFYTGQIALNASREGARIAASDTAASTYAGSCALASCYSLAEEHPLRRTALRANTALMSNTNLTLAMSGSGCEQNVTVTVAGDYNFTFYRMLRMFGATVQPTVSITRATIMRWEHQSPCT